MERSLLKVAVFNNDEFLLDALAEGLRLAGIQSACYLIEDLKSGKRDFARAIADSQADVVLYDLTPPFDRNWEFLQTIREGARASAGDVPVVLTTSNKSALQEFLGLQNITEFVGKPYELQEVVRALQARLPN